MKNGGAESSESARDEELLARIERLDLAHIAQEHRIWPLIHNVMKYKDAQGERQKIAIRALVFRMMFFFLAGGGVALAGAVGLWFSYKNNILLKEQNILAEAERRSALIFEISAIMDQVSEESSKWSKMNSEDKIDYIKVLGIRSPLCSEENFRRCVAGVPLSQATVGRIAALSSALRPYRHVDPETEDLTISARSPERGQMLIALINSGVFMRPIFARTSFEGADISNATIRDVDLTGINLTDAKANGTIFENVQFLEMTYAQGADFTNAAFCNVEFGQFVLKEAKFSGAYISRGELIGLTRYDGAEADIRDALIYDARIKRGESEIKVPTSYRERFGSNIKPAKGFREYFWSISNISEKEAKKINRCKYNY